MRSHLPTIDASHPCLARFYKLKRRQKKPLSESFTTESTETSADAFDPVNESIIRRLRAEDPSVTLLTVSSEDTDHLFLNCFCARRSSDLQLLGDLVAANTYLTELHVIMLDNMQLETDRFYKGLVGAGVAFELPSNSLTFECRTRNFHRARTRPSNPSD